MLPLEYDSLIDNSRYLSFAFRLVEAGITKAVEKEVGASHTAASCL